LALFLLKTGVVSKVSSLAVDTLIDDISLLLQSSVQSLQQDLSELFHLRNVELGPELDAIFTQSRVLKPFNGLQSKHLRRNFYRREFSWVVSVLHACVEIG
jgi:transposase-like protein